MTDIIKKSTQLTEGAIVYLGSLALAIATAFSLIQWNESFSLALCLGYVVYAQDLIGAFFEKESDDAIKRRIVMVLMIGYIAIFGISLWKWNDIVSGSVITGFLFFLKKIAKSYFGIPTENPDSSNSQPPKTP